MPLAPLGITDLRFTEKIEWSRERELNPQSTAYKTVALPLCYRGSLASTVISPLQEDSLVAVDARWDTCPSKWRDIAESNRSKEIDNLPY